MRNATKSLDENKQPNGKLEPFKHLQNNPQHTFDNMILLRAPSHRLKRKTLQSYFIKQLNRSPNDQLESNILIPFAHGVT